MDKIDHIVVLMMENRSFDSLLGKLYPKSERFNGLSGDEYNLFNGEKIFVWNDPEGGVHPSKDPKDSHPDMMEQIFGGEEVVNGGFSANYATKVDPTSPEEVMHYYTPDEVPVLSYLARQYAVCDAWFASAPCPTLPNRLFLHAGSAFGNTDVYPVRFPYRMPTVFSRFRDWGIYSPPFPHAALLTDTWKYLRNFHSFGKFLKDAERGNLPAYSFIEPTYSRNDQHPPSDLAPGEALIGNVYNALRTSPLWEKTMLVIIYDEHGGIYDHVRPPPAIPPEKAKSGQAFAFNYYGIRVPAVVVSPYIKSGTIFSAPHGTQPYDHTSVLKTLRTRFKLGKPFSAREMGAPDLAKILTLERPTNIGRPISIPL